MRECGYGCVAKSVGGEFFTCCAEKVVFRSSRWAGTIVRVLRRKKLLQTVRYPSHVSKSEVKSNYLGLRQKSTAKARPVGPWRCHPSRTSSSRRSTTDNNACTCKELGPSSWPQSRCSSLAPHGLHDSRFAFATQTHALPSFVRVWIPILSVRMMGGGMTLSRQSSLAQPPVDAEV